MTAAVAKRLDEVLAERRPPAKALRLNRQNVPTYPMYCTADEINLDTFARRHECLKRHPEAILIGWEKKNGRLRKDSWQRVL